MPTPLTPSAPDKIMRRSSIYLLLAAVLFGILAWRGIAQRQQHLQALRQTAQSTSMLPVAIVHPVPLKSSAVLHLPGELQGWQEASLRAHLNGYLRSWSKDIGTNVQRGELLAQIADPELDRQVLQAQATLASAQATADLAQLTASRWQKMVVSHSVSEQDLQEKIKDAEAKIAQLTAAKANLQALQAEQDYENLRAPFSGILSARRVDVGDLVQADAGPELFHLVDTHQLRLMVDVPQSELKLIPAAPQAELEVAEYPGQRFAAQVISRSGGIDPASRTLRLQLQVANSSGQLLPGAYASVRFRNVPGQSFSLPVTCLIFRGDGMQLASIRNGHVHLISVIPGRDSGKTMEILSGVDAQDQIINNPSDSIAEGDAVSVLPDRR